MDAFEVSTVVFLPPAEIYDFLADFPRYAKYSEYLKEVRAHGDGSPGTDYDLRFSWWKLGYTARSRVTDVDPPNRIDWALVKDLVASGHWSIEEVPEEAPEDRETASRVSLYVEFRPETADERALDLPRFVSLDWLVEKVTPMVEREAERVVERVVADLEGSPRDVELVVDDHPDRP